MPTTGNDSTKLRVGYSGAIYVGPVGSTMPADPFVAVDPGLINMGYVSDAGVTQTFGQNTADFMAWGNTNAPVLSRVTSEDTTFKFVLLQTTKEVMSFYYGLQTTDWTDTAAVTGVGAKPAYSKFTRLAASTPDVRAMVLDVVDGANTRRICIPRMQITAHGDLVYKSDTLVEYDITVRALLASDNSSFTEFITNI